MWWGGRVYLSFASDISPYHHWQAQLAARKANKPTSSTTEASEPSCPSPPEAPHDTAAATQLRSAEGKPDQVPRVSHLEAQEAQGEASGLHVSASAVEKEASSTTAVLAEGEVMAEAQQGKAGEEAKGDIVEGETQAEAQAEVQSQEGSGEVETGGKKSSSKRGKRPKSNQGAQV